jgi:parallel beta-helix repeat protein
MTRILLLTFILLAPANAQTPQPTPLSISRSISIADFGAKANGVADDTNAFVAAIAEAAKTGAELRLEDRTYLLKETLRLPNAGHPFSIVGGQRTRLLFVPDHPLDSGIQLLKAAKVELRSFTLHGAGAGLHHAISLAGSTDIRLDHLQIESIHGTGTSALSAILLGNDDQVWVTNNTFKDIGAGAGKPAFIIWNYYRMQSSHIYIEHNQMSGNAAYIALGMFDTNHSVVADNTIDGGNTCIQPCTTNGYGILFYRVGDSRLPPGTAPKNIDDMILGNHVSNTAGSGIYLASVDGATIAENTITRTTLQMDDSTLPAAGIALNGSDNIHILNNVIRADGRGGICLATTKDILIEGNQIYDSPEWGIRLRVRQVRTTIRNNTFQNAPMSIWVQQDVTDTRLDNNKLINAGQLMRHDPAY